MLCNKAYLGPHSLAAWAGATAARLESHRHGGLKIFFKGRIWREVASASGGRPCQPASKLIEAGMAWGAAARMNHGGKRIGQRVPGCVTVTFLTNGGLSSDLSSA